MCTLGLLWQPSYGSAVLMIISFTVLAGQICLVICMKSQRIQASGWMTDVNMMTMGTGGITGTLLLSVGLWACVIGVGGPGNAAAAQGHWMLAVAPFIVV